MAAMAKTRAFTVSSMVTVPLKRRTPSARSRCSQGTRGRHRWRVYRRRPRFAPGSGRVRGDDDSPHGDPEIPAESGRHRAFIAKLTDLPDRSRNDPLEATPNCRDHRRLDHPREGVFPYKRTGEASVAVLMTNPLDYAKRERSRRRTELAIDEVSVISAIFSRRSSKIFQGCEDGAGRRRHRHRRRGGIDQRRLLGRRRRHQGRGSRKRGFRAIIQLTNRIIEMPTFRRL